MNVQGRGYCLKVIYYSSNVYIFSYDYKYDITNFYRHFILKVIKYFFNFQNINFF